MGAADMHRGKEITTGNALDVATGFSSNAVQASGCFVVLFP